MKLLFLQMRTVCSQLAIFETEVGRLTENQASAENDWRDQTRCLQTELKQAVSQKVGETGTSCLLSGAP